MFFPNRCGSQIGELNGGEAKGLLFCTKQPILCCLHSHPFHWLMESDFLVFKEMQGSWTNPPIFHSVKNMMSLAAKNQHSGDWNTQRKENLYSDVIFNFLCNLVFTFSKCPNKGLAMCNILHWMIWLHAFFFSMLWQTYLMTDDSLIKVSI